MLTDTKQNKCSVDGCVSKCHINVMLLSIVQHQGGLLDLATLLDI